MARLSEEAAKQIRDRAIYYRQKHYDGALRNFRGAIENAGRRIDREPERGLTSPRPYPDVVVADVRWIIEGRYWFAYALDPKPATILAIFLDTDNIPGRI